jgi:hypothetical protein
MHGPALFVVVREEYGRQMGRGAGVLCRYLPQKLLGPDRRLVRQAVREQRESVRAARIDRQFCLVPRGYPAGMHEQCVVEQRIGRANGEQGWAQPLQVRIEGGRCREPGANR